MKKWKLSILLLVLVSLLNGVALQAQDPAPTMLRLSKDAEARRVGATMVLDLRTNVACDQTADVFPDGSQIVVTELNFLSEAAQFGLVSGTLNLQTPDGQVLQTMTLRGTFGLNPRRGAGRDCRFDHLEAMLDPVPTFAPVNAPQIKLAHLAIDQAVDLVPDKTAGLSPLYRAKLDGIVTLPSRMNKSVTINPDQTTYALNDDITVVIENQTNVPIMTYDLQSYCSIVVLQRQDGNEWEDVGPCQIKRRSVLVTIKAGETLRVVLAEDATSRVSKKPGVYRLAFNFLSRDGGKEETGQVFSPTFQIN